MEFLIEQVGKKKMYTELLLEYLVKQYGHQLTQGLNSIILVSLCDVVDIFALEKIRSKHPNSYIIAGGHFAKIGFKVASLFADFVWLGHAFDLFSCKTWQEIVGHSACYAPWKDNVLASTRIDWSQCPIIQTDKRRFYVWGGVGCRNKCSFCLTSWTEPHQERPGVDKLVEKSRHKIGTRGSVKLISNAYSTDLEDDLVQDMILRDLLKVVSNNKRKLIRCGVEFATEQSRKKHAKPIKDYEIKEAIKKAEKLNIDLQLFLIGGWDDIQDWYNFLDIIPVSDQLKPKVYLKWTNLEYQQKTPLWKYVQNINPDYYLDSAFTDWFFRKAAHKNKRIRVLPVKYPAHAIWRLCMSNAQNMEQYKECKKAKNEKDMIKMIWLFNRIKPWSNDLSRVITPPFDKL